MAWWPTRTSNPARGGISVFGAFDSHALPPKKKLFSTVFHRFRNRAKNPARFFFWLKSRFVEIIEGCVKNPLPVFIRQALSTLLILSFHFEKEAKSNFPSAPAHPALYPLPILPFIRGRRFAAAPDKETLPPPLWGAVDGGGFGKHPLKSTNFDNLLTKRYKN